MRTRSQVLAAVERLLSDIEFERALNPQVFVPFGPVTHFPDIGEEPNRDPDNFEWGVLVGKRLALRWVLNGRWDQPDRELLARDLKQHLSRSRQEGLD